MSFSDASDNMNISHLIVHARRVEEATSNRKDKDSKRVMSFEGELQRIGLIFKISLDSRRYSQIKFHSSFLRLMMKRSLRR